MDLILAGAGLPVSSIGKVYIPEHKQPLHMIHDAHYPVEMEKKVVFASKFTPRPFTTQIMRLYGDRIFYDPKTGILWGYNSKKGVWEDVEPEIKKLLRTKLLGLEQLKTHYVNEVINDLKDITAQERPEEPPWWLINIKNGVFNVKTGELTEHSHKYFFTNVIPHEINEEHKDCPIIDRLFTEWVGEEHKRTLYELCAYSLIRAYPYRKMFILYGAGANGKSTFANLLRRLVGADNVSGVGLEELSNSNFAGARLFRKLVNIAGEVNVTNLNKTDLIKRLTGEDAMCAREKYKPMFEFVNYAKLIFLTNAVPMTRDKTIGFYRRLYFIEFPNSFEGKERGFLIEELPEAEIEGLLYKCLFEVLPRLYRRRFIFATKRLMPHA